MFFLGVPFFSFLSFFNSKFINCSKSFVLKCKIQSIRDWVFISLRYVDAILILLTRDVVRFQTWILAHWTLLDIIDLLFTWIQKHSKETENRDTVVYRRWEDRFVRIRKKWSSFSLGTYGPSQNLKVKKRASKKETNDSQHGPNKVFIIITIYPISRQYTGKCELSRQS